MESIINLDAVMIAVVIATYLEYLHWKWIQYKVLEEQLEVK